MPPTAAQNELERLQASKARSEASLQKVRQHRVADVIKDLQRLYEVERFLIEKGHLDSTS